jgi:hypothetical protein
MFHLFRRRPTWNACSAGGGRGENATGMRGELVGVLGGAEGGAEGGVEVVGVVGVAEGCAEGCVAEGWAEGGAVEGRPVETREIRLRLHVGDILSQLRIRSRGHSGIQMASRPIRRS